jgi:nitrite reductase (NO-forming)
MMKSILPWLFPLLLGILLAGGCRPQAIDALPSMAEGSTRSDGGALQLVTAQGGTNSEEFTLLTQFAGGRLSYIGIGNAIDGMTNPDLVVPVESTVQIVLTNGDGMPHDIFFPDFDAKSAAIGRKGQVTGLAFTIAAEHTGTYVYYCTQPGHRAAGQEGKLIVIPAD